MLKPQGMESHVVFLTCVTLALVFFSSVNDPVAAKLLRKAGEMPSLVPPDDDSIRTLYVGGLDSRISEEDLKDQFYGYGEVESIRLVAQRACAFISYTTREGAEKAAENLANKLVIKGLRLKLMWGKPQVPKQDGEGASAESIEEGLKSAAGAISHGGMLPRSLLSQQQQMPPQPGQDQPTSLNYFNIPLPAPPSERPFYPSMDPQRMGAVVHREESSSSGNHAGGGGASEAPANTSQAQFGPPPANPYPYPPPPPPYQQQMFRPYPNGPPPYQQYPPFPPGLPGPPGLAGPSGPPGAPGTSGQYFHPQY